MITSLFPDVPPIHSRTAVPEASALYDKMSINNPAHHILPTSYANVRTIYTGGIDHFDLSTGDIR